MNSQWMWGAFPELMQLETTADRWSLWHKSYGAVINRSAYWAIAGAIQIGAQVVLGIPVARFCRSFSWYNRFVEFGVPILIAVLMCFVIIWIFKRQIHRQLRRNLTARGLPTCIRCGYDLRGLPDESPRCPECGSNRPTAGRRAS